MLIGLLLIVGLSVTVFLIGYQSYFQFIGHLSAQVSNQNSEQLPGSPPHFLMGNMLEVYQSPNQLSAYHRFHKQFGEIVQIFWMWRLQVSTASHQMAHHILVSNQRKYRKYPPNSILKKLYGSSVLTNEGAVWQRQRLLMQQVFSKKQIGSFYGIFIAHSKKLASKWSTQLRCVDEPAVINIYPDLLNVFLDVVGHAAIGRPFGALEGKTDDVFEHVSYLISQSTKPQHQFTSWWKYVPIPANRRLFQAFTVVDDFIHSLIQERREKLQGSAARNILDLLLTATDVSEGRAMQFTDEEVRDNLLAIILNGHETVATSVSFTLYLLACHPEKLAVAQAEADQWFEQNRIFPSPESGLPYLESVINESLRLYPPMAGLQRISTQADTLGEWSIPANQVIGIPLAPLHLSEEHFGPQPDQFHPERYLEPASNHQLEPGLAIHSTGRCPFAFMFRQQGSEQMIHTKPRQPLSFGDGARKCLGEHFARAEMKVAIATLLHHFNFEVAPNKIHEPELGKFGLFISMFPKEGMELILSRRSTVEDDAVHLRELQTY